VKRLSYGQRNAPSLAHGYPNLCAKLQASVDEPYLCIQEGCSPYSQAWLSWRACTWQPWARHPIHQSEPRLLFLVPWHHSDLPKRQTAQIHALAHM